MSVKEKWLTVLACFVILVLFAGFGIFRKAPISKGISSTDELQGRSLGGIEGRMPPASAKIFFESMLGVKLSGYKTYKNTDEALYALRTGRTDALWSTDITAQYLTTQNDDLRLLENVGTADIMNIPDERFSFGFALKNNDEGKALADEINTAIGMLKKSGRLDEMLNTYVYDAGKADKYYEDDRTDTGKAYSSKKPVRIGITGAVEPVELIDADGKPYGFCVAMAEEIGIICERQTELVILDNETAFSSLMTGRVDAMFCYGTPGQITTEGSKNWIMTDGYLTCKGYRLISTAYKEEQ